MHLHCHRLIDETISARYERCRCGHRQITSLAAEPYRSVDWAWLDEHHHLPQEDRGRPERLVTSPFESIIA